MRVMIQEQDYDLGAPWPGTLIHHRADCPARDAFHATSSNGASAPPVDGFSAIAPAFMPDTEPTPDTVARLIDDFLEDARNGHAADPDGQAFDADRLNDLRWSLRTYVASELGMMRIQQLNATELKAFTGRLDTAGLSPARTK